MKTMIYPSLAVAFTALSTPAFGQDLASDAAEAAAEAAEEAMEAVDSAVEVDVETREAPPAVVVRPRAVEIKPNYPLKPRPISMWQIFRPADYPPSAWAADEEGTVEYRVAVSAEGNSLSCEVVGSSGYQALDEAICPIIMQRAKFTPAYAAKDKPVRGTYMGAHRWRKRDTTVPSMAITYQFTQTAEGLPKDCQVLRIEGTLPEPMRKDIERNDGCLFSRPDRYGVPYRDEEGNPIDQRVTFKLDIAVEDVPEE